MTQPLIIIGASGNASDMLDAVHAINIDERSWSVMGVLDDRKPVGSVFMDLEVIGAVSDACRYEDCSFINAIGSPTSYPLRPKILESTSVAIDRFATILHPHSSISQSAHIGRGVMASFGATVGGGAHIGDHVLLGPGVIVGHDAIIEDHTVVAPGAVICGFCHIGKNTYIGAGAMIRTYLRVGDRAIVGMGAVVISDIDSNAVAVGNPARLLRRMDVAGSARAD
jgi:sugar O-acyltransferase (sialic acid O-acetyltransferase NeuD family)